MSASRNRSRSTSNRTKSKRQSALLSELSDVSDLNLLLDGPEQIMGLKVNHGFGGPGGGLFTKEELEIYKICTQMYITDIKKNEKNVIPHKNPDVIKVREFVRKLPSHLKSMQALHTKIIMNDMSKDKYIKEIFLKHQKQIEQIIKTIERLMRIHYRRLKGLQDLVGGPRNVARLTGGPSKSIEQILKDRELSRERKQTVDKKKLSELQKKYGVPEDFDYDKTIAELEDMGYIFYKKSKKAKGKKSKKAKGKKKKGGSLRTKRRSRRKTQRR